LKLPSAWTVVEVVPGATVNSGTVVKVGALPVELMLGVPGKRVWA
jgi:hypothetical protein